MRSLYELLKQNRNGINEVQLQRHLYQGQCSNQVKFTVQSSTSASGKPVRSIGRRQFICHGSLLLCMQTNTVTVQTMQPKIFRYKEYKVLFFFFNSRHSTFYSHHQAHFYVGELKRSVAPLLKRFLHCIQNQNKHTFCKSCPFKPISLLPLSFEENGASGNAHPGRMIKVNMQQMQNNFVRF